MPAKSTEEKRSNQEFQARHARYFSLCASLQIPYLYPVSPISDREIHRPLKKKKKEKKNSPFRKCQQLSRNIIQTGISKFPPFVQPISTSIVRPPLLIIVENRIDSQIIVRSFQDEVINKRI